MSAPATKRGKEHRDYVDKENETHSHYFYNTIVCGMLVDMKDVSNVKKNRD